MSQQGTQARTNDARGHTFTLHSSAHLPARTHPRRCSLALTRTHPHGHLNKQTHVCTHTHTPTQSHTHARARTHTTTRAARTPLLTVMHTSTHSHARTHATTHIHTRARTGARTRTLCAVPAVSWNNAVRRPGAHGLRPRRQGGVRSRRCSRCTTG